MRVAMIGLRGIPASYSGVETAVEEIATRLAANGNEVCVYCMRLPGIPRTRMYRGVRLIHVPTLPGKSTQMVVYSLLATLHALILRRDDVIHLHALGPAVMAIPCWLLRRRVVVTCHGRDYLREKWGAAARAYLRLGEWASARLANGIIAVSCTLRAHFEALGARNVHYVPNGAAIPQRTAPGDLLARFKLEPGGYLLFVGRLVECKRVNQLIAAFRSVATPLRLLIVGDGPMPIVADLRELASQDDRVVMAGRLHGKELAEAYSNAALFVLPSVLEGLSMSLIEAMSYDLPVLVSDIPENLEVVSDHAGHRATVFRSDEVQSLASGLREAIADAERTPLEGRGNAAFVARRYDWDLIVRDTSLCYHAALREDDWGEEESKSE